MKKCTRCKKKTNEVIELEEDLYVCRNCAEKWKEEIERLVGSDVVQSLFEEAQKYDDPISFRNALMVGPCPKCGSNATRDCEGTEIDDICVGICLKCLILWCLECGAVFKEGQKVCEHWKVCDECVSISKDGTECLQGFIDPAECPRIQELVL